MLGAVDQQFHQASTQKAHHGNNHAMVGAMVSGELVRFSSSKVVDEERERMREIERERERERGQTS